jgi:uncharacterized DUF497 family protein
MVEGFEFETALIWQDIRKIYPEVRFSALGLISGRVYSLMFTEAPMGIRVIIFRKANALEVRQYAQEAQS